MDKEFILCAAIWINDKRKHEQQPINILEGFVVAGRRHNNCYQTISSISGLSTNEALRELFDNMSEEDHRRHQGFITSFDRYVDRYEGWRIAKENNQIQFGRTASEDGKDSILISENLY